MMPDPDPEPRAALHPPDRHPPTAVGTLTPPPPPPRRGPQRGFPFFNWNRALFIAFLVTGLVGAALFAYSDPFWLRAAGGSLMALGILGPWRFVALTLMRARAASREQRWLRTILSRG